MIFQFDMAPFFFQVGQRTISATCNHHQLANLPNLLEIHRRIYISRVTFWYPKIETNLFYPSHPKSTKYLVRRCLEPLNPEFSQESLDPPLEGFWTCIAGVWVLKIATFEGSGFSGHHECSEMSWPWELYSYMNILHQEVFNLWAFEAPERFASKKQKMPKNQQGASYRGANEHNEPV